MNAADERLVRWLERLPGSPASPCHYLRDEIARQQQFFWPDTLGQMPGATYQLLMDHRFRRSGRLFYRPACGTCTSCIPIRLNATTFIPSRSQERAQRKNRDLEVRWALPRLDADRADLYARYSQLRHDKQLEGADLGEELEAFLYDSPTDTIEASYWLDGKLVACGICDLTPQAVSSVYFYFDPQLSARSLGVYSAVVEIAYARATGRQHYYLGYWVPGCRKMEYKAGFGEHELLVEGSWVRTPRRL